MRQGQGREIQWYSPADRRDRADARKLWEEIFPEDSESFLDYYDRWKAGRNRMETRRRSGQLISMIQWNPYRIRMGDLTEDSYYVIAVATKPEYRHQGLMAGQLRDGFRRFRAEGVPFLFLMPADPAIYEPFDFRYIYDRTVMTVPVPQDRQENRRDPGQLRPAAMDAGDGTDVRRDPGQLRPAAMDAGDGTDASASGFTVRPLTPGEWEAAASFSEERLADHFRVYAERDTEYVERSAMECRSEGGEAEGIFRGECMVGTFSWWWETETVVGIREMILLPEFETEPGLTQIREALVRRWPGAEQIRAVMAVGRNGFAAASGDPEPIIMGRILNLPEFLKGFACPETMQTVLHVKDRYIPENNGAFLWTMGPEGSVLEPLAENAAEKSAPEVPDGKEPKESGPEISRSAVSEGSGEIRAEIGELLSWLTGYRDLRECKGTEAAAEGQRFASCVRPFRGVFFPEIV